MKLEHIDKLSKGLKSGANIGSRKTSHRLRKYERDIYERALKKKFLEIQPSDRINLENLWEKVCLVKKWDNIIFLKNKEDSQVLKNGSIIFTGNLAEGKEFMKNYF